MTTSKLLTLAAFFIVVSAAVSKAATITASNFGNLTQMPGSPTDYTFLGKDNQFAPDNFGYGGGSPDTGVQTDFSMASLVSESYGGDGRYAVINNPLGVSTQTGILFGRDGVTNQNLLQLTLGHTGFTYSNFDLFVLYGNDLGDTYARNSGITVTDMTKGVSLTLNITETNTSFSEASFAEFHIVGASAGDVIDIGAQSPGGFNYIGGVSLVTAPEPATYAMMLGGLAFLGWLSMRRSRKALL